MDPRDDPYYQAMIGQLTGDTPSPAAGNDASAYAKELIGPQVSPALQAIQGIAIGPDQATPALLVARLQQDYGLSRPQALGAVGWMGYESGDFKKMQEMGHSGTGSGWGWAQWTGPRRAAFMDYAKANNLDPSSFDANYGYLQQELAGFKSHVIPALKETNTIPAANAVWGKLFEGMRPGGPGVPAFAQHAARALQYDAMMPGAYE